MDTLKQELARVARIAGEGEGGVIGVSDDGIRVGVRTAAGRGTRWLVAYASLCPVRSLDPRAVLARNSELVATTIVPVGDEYVLRFAAPLDSAEARDVAGVVTQLLAEARALRPSAQPAADGDARLLFAHYVD